jgi:hypothetical protein
MAHQVAANEHPQMYRRHQATPIPAPGERVVHVVPERMKDLPAIALHSQLVQHLRHLADTLLA